MRSSELQAKIDAMDPEARTMFLRRLDELFAEITDFDDASPFDFMTAGSTRSRDHEEA